MKPVMTKASLIVSATAALVMMAGVASARADARIVVTVPFDFIVGTTQLPSGDYTVTESSSAPGVVVIASADGEHMAQVLTLLSAASDEAIAPSLVFERYEGKYFLSKVVSRDDSGREIPLTPALMERWARG